MNDPFFDENARVKSDKRRDKSIKDLQAVRNQWVDRYEPATLDEVILPESIKNAIKFSISNNSFTNMIFHSAMPGTGKTTVAKLIPKEFGCQYFFIKAATEARLSTVENDIPMYGMQQLGDEKPRWVVLDEADKVRSNFDSFYTALQPIIESTSSTLRFILTVNRLYAIPKPILSRCKPISFSHNDNSIKKPMFKKLVEIAEAETTKVGGSVDKNTIKQIARINFPDMRAMINEMQYNFNANGGSITGNVETISVDHVKRTWELLKKGDIKEVRKYFTENVLDIVGFYYPFLDYVFEHSVKEDLLSIGAIIGEHQFRTAYDGVDPEININGMFCEIIQVLNG